MHPQKREEKYLFFFGMRTLGTYSLNTFQTHYTTELTVVTTLPVTPFVPILKPEVDAS